MSPHQMRELAALLMKSPADAGSTSVHRAIDSAGVMLGEAIDTVCEVALSEHAALALVQCAAQGAVQTYAAQLQADAMRDGLADIAAAIREAAPELAGAVSEAGTDIGAGVLAALSTLAPGGEPATA